MISARYAERRARVRDALGPRGALILAASPELHVGADTELRYVVDSDLYYLTGYTEPEAVMVMRGGSDDVVLFVRPRDAARELWTGIRGGVDAAREIFGATAHSIHELEQELPRLLDGVDMVFARGSTGRADADRIVSGAIAQSRQARNRTGHGAATVSDPGVILNEMRLFKDAEEVACMRNAADVSVAAFRDACRVIADGAGEWQIEAALQHGFRSRRATGEAFSSIVASGENATILHYVTNDDVLRGGGMVLLDAGARAAMYCADITRTYAVGTMSAELRAVHDIVRAAHDAAIAACTPGRTIADVDRAARTVLVEGMIDLRLVEGPASVALSRDEYKRFYPHRTCHWLGIDVHDVGSYVEEDGSPRILREGMVFTVEPGLYIPRTDDRAGAALRGIGVRLEDDVFITGDGAEVLTSALPLGPDPAEAFA